MRPSDAVRETDSQLPVILEEKGGNDLQHILLRLVDQAKKEPHRRQKFASFKWKSLESVKSSQLIKDALQATLECSITKSEVEVLFSHYRTHDNTFDYAAFLLDFATRYEQPVKLPEAVPKPLTSRKPSHGRVLELWQKTRTEAAAISAANGFIASIEDKSRQRALLALEEALKRRLTNRFHDSASAIESMGNIQKKDFRAAMRNGLNLNLSVLEANSLFDVFDTNDDGVVTSTELAAAIHRMMHESRRRLQDEVYATKQKCRIRPERVRVAFNTEEFKRAMVILTDTVTDTSELYLPDNLLSQAFIRTCIYDQLGVKLSSLQMQCLCHKLSKVRPQPYLARNRLIRTYSSSSSTDSETKSDGEDYMNEAPINGKIIESFYFQLRKFILKPV